MVLNLLRFVALCLDCSPSRLLKTKKKYFHSQHQPQTIRNVSIPTTSWVRFNRLRTGVGLFLPLCTDREWLPEQPVSVVQRSNRRPHHNILPHFYYPSSGLGLESDDKKTVG